MTTGFRKTGVLGQNEFSAEELCGPYLMKYVAVSAVLLMPCRGVSRAGVEAGSAAYASGDDAVAQYWLGWLYATGRGVARNESRDTLRYRKAADGTGVGK